MTATTATTARPTAADLIAPKTIRRAGLSADAGAVSAVQRLGDASVTRWFHSDSRTRSVEFSLFSRGAVRVATRSHYLPRTENVVVAMQTREDADDGTATETELIGFLRVDEARKLHERLGAALAAADAAE